MTGNLPSDDSKEMESYFGEETATFGDRVAHAREALGLTQKELAARLGIRDVTLVKWENDRSEPRANKLQMLAGLLNVSMIWLMTGQGDGPSQDPDWDNADMQSIILELRAIKTDANQLGTRIARLEKALRSRLHG